MSTQRKGRPHTLQPELPLPMPAAPEVKGGQPDWHLDEETRVVGRQGIAAARALLDQSHTGADGKRHEGEPGRAGRAA